MTLLIVFFHDQTNIGKLSILLRNYMHFVLLTVFVKLVIIIDLCIEVKLCK